MSLKEYLQDRVNAIEKEFEKIITDGFGPDSPFYDYIEDLKTTIGKLNE